MKNPKDIWNPSGIETANFRLEIVQCHFRIIVYEVYVLYFGPFRNILTSGTVTASLSNLKITVKVSGDEEKNTS
jgi:hypothetical protein